MRMDDAARNEVAECLEQLADQGEWNSELWRRCHSLVQANGGNELVR